jgi:NADH-quinone oxidoreductase subunit J
MVEVVVFILAAAVCLAGALGVILSENPVHAALSLVGTLFGIAVLFVAQEAHFLAVVQVIVYAGAIVVLFLFVLMLLGVDRLENLRVEPLVGQRVAAAVVALGILGLTVGALSSTGFEVTGFMGEIDVDVADVNRLGESLFTDYVFAFEITAVLLIIAVVGAVVLARRSREPEIVDPGQAERSEEVSERMAAAEARAEGVLPASGNGSGQPSKRPVPATGGADPAEGDDGPPGSESETP